MEQKRNTQQAKERMKVVDKRLDRMIEIADELDVPLDHVVKHIGRSDQRAFEAVSERPSLLPRYMKSNVTP
ncbi:hypothetical protein MHM97_12365 [Epibacterium sp. Ofav1-8]|jgi:hypothetical protein|nr:hypothetical protein [Epibacterium sp. Ofav1-8]